VVALPGYAQDKAEFQRIADRFVEAYAKGDLNSVLRLYAEDAYVLPPQATMVKGQNDIANFWKEEARRTELKEVTVMDAKTLGNNTAHVIFTSVGRTRDAAPKEIKGKGTALAQKVGDDWRMLVHIWNRDDPVH
jgi:uncharacterized protein (TIGR02246 family)